MNMRRLLFPFGWFYGAIAALRRWLFDLGVFKRRRAVIPTIVVGNLTVGGTGKSPFTRFLAQTLISHQPAVLSRGYGRKTKGFREVLTGDNAGDCGDEPLELRHLLPETARNYVCEKRLAGIESIKAAEPATGLVLLDDGFQHLPLKPDAAILLCDYNRPFFKDWPMPAGLLREFASTARFADAIVVTKCPADMGAEEAFQWRQKLARYGVPVYFSAYVNEQPPITSDAESDREVLLITGLANHKPFTNWAAGHFKIAGEFHYPDHYAYSQRDIDQWQAFIQSHPGAIILTTGKDAVKIRALNAELPLWESRVHPEILFGGEDDLIRLLLTKIERNV